MKATLMLFRDGHDEPEIFDVDGELLIARSLVPGPLRGTITVTVDHVEQRGAVTAHHYTTREGIGRVHFIDRAALCRECQKFIAGISGVCGRCVDRANLGGYLTRQRLASHPRDVLEEFTYPAATSIDDIRRALLAAYSPAAYGTKVHDCGLSPDRTTRKVYLSRWASSD